MVKFTWCVFCQYKTTGEKHIVASVGSFTLGKPQWYGRTLKDPYGHIEAVKNWGFLPASLHQPANHVRAPSWKSALRPCQAFRWRSSWTTSSPQPHQRVRSTAMQLSHSQIPEPKKLCEVINIYCCFEPRSAGIICYLAIDNWHISSSVK